MYIHTHTYVYINTPVGCHRERAAILDQAHHPRPQQQPPRLSPAISTAAGPSHGKAQVATTTLSPQEFSVCAADGYLGDDCPKRTHSPRQSLDWQPETQGRHDSFICAAGYDYINGNAPLYASRDVRGIVHVDRWC